MLTIGLLLGTFDPPHFGHIYAACKALNQVDFVAIVPAWVSPWKKNATPYEKRLQMCLNSFKFDNITVWDIDSQIKSNNSYEFLKAIENPDVCFKIICGSDINISEWHEHDWIKEHYKTITIPRCDFKCSSTQIRETIKEGKDPRPLITQEVYYIAKEIYK